MKNAGTPSNVIGFGACSSIRVRGPGVVVHCGGRFVDSRALIGSRDPVVDERGLVSERGRGVRNFVILVSILFLVLNGWRWRWLFRATRAAPLMTNPAVFLSLNCIVHGGLLLEKAGFLGERIDFQKLGLGFNPSLDCLVEFVHLLKVVKIEN
jgi:hypothetical protein